MTQEQYRAEASRLKKEIKNLNASRTSLTNQEEIETAKSQIHKLQVEYNEVQQKIKELKDDYKWQKSIDREFNSYKGLRKMELVSNMIKNNQTPSNKPIIYRWWFVENSSVVEIIRRNLCDKEFQQISKEKIDKGVYHYAMYVGKGANGKRRFKNHISPRIRTSTLRRTIAALLETNNEDAITTVLKNCYYEWWEIECDKKTLAEKEKEKINDGYHPLNLKENNKVCTKWKKFLQEQRKKV